MATRPFPAHLSPLKYAGNKTFLAKRLEKLILTEIDPDSRVVEPFAGSLGFSLYFGFQNVVANDLNRPLINFYQHIQSGHLPEFYSDISEPAYYQNRSRFNELVAAGDYGREMASLLIFLNAIGFNGLWRTNQCGEFNVPYGKQTAFPLEKLERCTALTQLFTRWQFSSLCYSKLLNIVENAGLIYADPPYLDTFTAYSGNSFGLGHQHELCAMLSRFDCPVIISNSLKSPLLARLYSEHGFTIYRTKVARRIAAKASSRKKVDEVVAFKNFTTKRIATLCPELERVRAR